MSFERNAHANSGRLLGRQLARELADIVGGNTGDLLGPFRRPGRRPFFKRFEADRVVGDVVFIDQALINDRIDDRHGEGRIRAGLGADMPISFLGSSRLISIDHHDLCARLLGIFHDGPMMQIGADAVASPNDDVLRMNIALRINASSRTHGQQPGCTRTFTAERAFAHSRAHTIEEGVSTIQAMY